jgi:hypothetical protein
MCFNVLRLVLFKQLYLLNSKLKGLHEKHLPFLVVLFCSFRSQYKNILPSVPLPFGVSHDGLTLKDISFGLPFIPARPHWLFFYPWNGIYATFYSSLGSVH